MDVAFPLLFRQPYPAAYIGVGGLPSHTAELPDAAISDRNRTPSSSLV